MGKVRKIDRVPSNGRNYYLVDANFLANWAIPPKFAPIGVNRTRIEQCLDWWTEIEKQMAAHQARVYVPDLCIAETFKVLAKKYYDEKWFPSAVALNNTRNRLRKLITTGPSTLRAARRNIRFHDISTTRDIVISIDRFYELFHKHKLGRVSVPDLIIVATAKYLLDFFDIPKERLHIVTLDRDLRLGARKIAEIPNAYDPTEPADHAIKVFR